jgi:TolB protein
LEFDPSDVKGHQVLPPTGTTVTQSQDEGAGGGSSTGQFSAVYGDMGTSFRQAKWCAGGVAIAAVMMGDRGDTLVIQPISNPGEPIKKPLFLATGDHIDFDVSPKDGSVVFSVTHFRWTAESKAPKEDRPRHFVGLWKPGMGQPSFILGSRTDDIAFGAPAVSPQGDKLLLTVGVYDTTTSELSPLQLVTIPVQENAGSAVAKLAQGAIFEPTWSPQGDLIAYARSANGTRGIYVAKADGTGEHPITGDTGHYSYPKFSPQTKP